MSRGEKRKDKDSKCFHRDDSGPRHLHGQDPMPKAFGANTRLATSSLCGAESNYKDKITCHSVARDGPASSLTTIRAPNTGPTLRSVTE